MTFSATKINNPAGRLLPIFQKLRGYPHPGQKATEAWAAVLQCPADDFAQFMGKLAGVVEMVAATRRLVSALPDDLEPHEYLTHLDQIEAVVKRFPHFSNQTLEWSLSGLDDAGMMSLRLCSTLLSRHSPEPVLPADDLQRILEDLREVVQAVRDTDDLDEDTRAFLLRLLLKVCRAVEDHDLFGAQAIEDALNEFTGSLARKASLLSRIKQSKTWSAVTKTVVALDIALNLVANSQQAIGTAPASTPSPVIVEIMQSDQADGAFGR